MNKNKTKNSAEHETGNSLHRDKRAQKTQMQTHGHTDTQKTHRCRHTKRYRYTNTHQNERARGVVVVLCVHDKAQIRVEIDTAAPVSDSPLSLSQTKKLAHS
jgi:hypothetical protein